LGRSLGQADRPQGTFSIAEADARLEADANSLDELAEAGSTKQGETT
jgi:hypothetical protein